MTGWFHGSPLKLSVLRAGSTITQDRDVARIVSHKPTLVARGDDGTLIHNGHQPGFLYAVEDVGQADVYPHPETTMDPGLEWIVQRSVQLTLLETTVPRSEELLTSDDEIRLWAQHQGG